MFKKVLALPLVLALSSCSWFWNYDEEYRICPMVDITDFQLAQRSSVGNEFKLEIVGVDGYCYIDEETGINKAVVNPVVKITRTTDGDETDVHFAFYTETLKGPPEFLGKRTHHTHSPIPRHQKEVLFRPNPVERDIPHELLAEYDMNIGLIITPKEKQYNRKAF